MTNKMSRNELANSDSMEPNIWLAGYMLSYPLKCHLIFEPDWITLIHGINYEIIIVYQFNVIKTRHCKLFIFHRD